MNTPYKQGWPRPLPRLRVTAERSKCVQDQWRGIRHDRPIPHGRGHALRALVSGISALALLLAANSALAGGSGGNGGGLDIGGDGGRGSDGTAINAGGAPGGSGVTEPGAEDVGEPGEDGDAAGNGGDGGSGWPVSSGSAGGDIGGGAGSDGGDSGNGGGGGGDGRYITADEDITENVAGGRGGNGGNNSGGARLSGGGGGGGGAAVISDGQDHALEVGDGVSLAGGAGGNGGHSDGVAGGGGGGGAGIGASGLSISNIGIIGGGDGGTGGEAGLFTSGAGAGGDGGAGIVGSDIAINNSGDIQGGDGGAGGDAGSSGDGDGGAGGGGGAGIAGSGLFIVNSGRIVGGKGGYGGVGAGADGADGAAGNAITFTGGENTLTLETGSSIEGDISVSGELTFDQADSVTLSSVLKGSGSITKADAGTLTLSGANTYSGGTTVSGGTLVGDTTSLQGDIVNNARLTFDQDTDGTYADAISGGGLLQKMGSGTVTFDGINTYTGGTWIQAGTLRAGTASALQDDTPYTVDVGTLDLNGHDMTMSALAGDGGTVDLGGAALTVNQSGDTRFEGNITGGGLTKTGAGTLELTGTASLNDATMVNGGLLDLSGSTMTVSGSDLTVGQAGAGELLLRNQATADVGGFTLGFATDTAGTVIVEGVGSRLRTSAGGSGVLTVGWSGRGSATVRHGGQIESRNGAVGAIAGGTGDVIVTGADSRWSVDDVLSVGRQGEGSLRILDEGEVSADEVLIGWLASSQGVLRIADGALAVVDSGGGTMTIAQDASATGTLIIGAAAGDSAIAPGRLETGTLVFGAGEGTLLFNHTGSAYGLDADITGSGTLRHLAGHTEFTGDASAFSGETTIDGGTLRVNGHLAGTLQLNDGATLGGAGTVGHISAGSGAIIAPGNSIGTLTVDGDLNLASGSRYEVEVDPVGADSDLIHVTGDATLAGAVIHIGENGSYQPLSEYTILTADGVINGAFDTVSSDFAFLDPSLGYSADAVTLTLERNAIDFAGTTRTDNQRDTANGVESVGGGEAYNTVLGLSAAQAPGAFDALSGEAHASTQGALQQHAGGLPRRGLEALRGNLGAGLRPGQPTASASGYTPAAAMPRSNAYPVWLVARGQDVRLDADGNAARLDQRSHGLQLGADAPLGDWRLGGAFGYADQDLQVKERASETEADSYQLALYAGRNFALGAGRVHVIGGAGWAHHEIESRRRVVFPGFSENLLGDYSAQTRQLFTEAGYTMPLTMHLSLTPYLALDWSEQRTESFREKGGSAALQVDGSSNRLSTSTFGLRATQQWGWQEYKGTVRTGLGWRHADGDLAAESTHRFAGGQAFTVAGAPIARNAAVLGLGLDVALAGQAVLGLDYDGQYGAGNREHSGEVSLRWRF